MSERSALLERLEKATVGSKELDVAIHELLGWKLVEFDPGDGDVIQYWKRGADELDADQRRSKYAYTQSLDAAMTLKKPGNYDFSLSFTTRGGPEFTEWQARVALHEVADDPDETGPQALGEGRTAALACCIAFLKAGETT